MNPIIIIPGICGSQLQAVNLKTKNVEDVWMPSISKKSIDNIINNLWGYNSNGVFKSFNKENDIQPTPGLKGVATMSNRPIFKSLTKKYTTMIKKLKQIGYIENETLFAFPYDWRQDPTSQFIVEQLSNLVDNIFQKAGKQIIIIAHSMGCVVSKSYIVQKNEQAEQKISQFIAISGAFKGCSSSGIELAKIYGNEISKNLALRCLLQQVNSMYFVLSNISFQIKGKLIDESFQIAEVMPSKQVTCKHQSSQLLYDLLFENKIETPSAILTMLETQSAHTVFNTKVFKQIFYHTFDKSNKIVKEMNVRNDLSDQKEQDNNISFLDFLQIQPGNSKFLKFLFPFDEQFYKDVLNRMKQTISVSKIKHDVIIGTKVQTQGDIIFQEPDCIQNLIFQKPQHTYCDGDSVIHTASQSQSDLPNAILHYVEGVEHQNMIKDDQVMKLLFGGILLK
ncbi:Lecithin-cholesterol_acyltransferase [Hexamita inflata]|uniref:Lecithin-cholesterol acyltransferase n=1 Tax=Hexamita inflata TaxID=28002 RepID=A0AA86REQ8_9EUKA|nr:Lecithin-cholesterol acyltransferase [Hexamita inflata]